MSKARSSQDPHGGLHIPSTPRNPSSVPHMDALPPCMHPKWWLNTAYVTQRFSHRGDIGLPALERADGGVGVSSASKETGGGGGGRCRQDLGVVAVKGRAGREGVRGASRVSPHAASSAVSLPGRSVPLLALFHPSLTGYLHHESLTLTGSRGRHGHGHHKHRVPSSSPVKWCRGCGRRWRGHRGTIRSGGGRGSQGEGCNVSGEVVTSLKVEKRDELEL